jgi:hypothetical protein
MMWYSTSCSKTYYIRLGIEKFWNWEISKLSVMLIPEFKALSAKINTYAAKKMEYTNG